MLSAAAWLAPATGLRGQDQVPGPAPAALFELAGALGAAEQWAEAAGVYAQILELAPNSQRAMVMLGACWVLDGQASQAVPLLEQGIAMNPYAYWAEVGLYYSALGHHQLGDDEAASAVIELLQQQVPESQSAARAQIIAAQIAGADVETAEADYELEVVAATQLQSALAAVAAADVAPAIELLDAVIESYPGSGAALRARESKGTLLIYDHQLSEGMAEFLLILEQIGRTHPAARIVANSKLQLAAGYFETLMLPPEELAMIEPAESEQARSLCQQVLELEQASPLQVARAELMIIETYHWQKCWPDTVEAAQAYIAGYDPVQFRREVATAHMLAGESLHMMGQPGPAMPHFQWIISEYSLDEEIWPRLHNLARTYYWVFDILYQAQAPLDQVLEAGYAVLENFPGTRGAQLVENALAFIEEHGWPNP